MRLCAFEVAGDLETPLAAKGDVETRSQSAGFTPMNDFGAQRSALSPRLVVPDEIASRLLRPKFENTGGDVAELEIKRIGTPRLRGV